MKTHPLTSLILCPYKSALHNLFVGTPQQCDGINCMCFVEDVAGVSGHCGLIFEPVIEEVTTVKTVEAVTNVASVDAVTNVGTVANVTNVATVANVTNIQSIDDPIVGEPV
jgi:hypothetical protein